MQKAKSTVDWTERTLESLSENDPRPVRMRDRSVPVWAAALSIFFSAGTAACIVALLVFIAFYQEIVARQGQEIMSYLLTLGAGVPILGILIFEVGRNKSLAGYRDIRERNAALGHAIIAMLVTGGLGFIHPLLLVPFAIGAVLSWLVVHPIGNMLSPERMWEFLPSESVSFLSGRDKRAVDLANSRGDKDPVVDTLLQAIRYMSLMFTMGLTTWLAAREVVSLPAIASIAFLNFWATRAYSDILKRFSRSDPELEGRAASVTLVTDTDDDGEPGGLKVRNLFVTTPEGHPLISDVSFDLSPGVIVGLKGDEFSGKSLLMRALASPHDLTNLDIRGGAFVEGEALWLRSALERDIASVYVPPWPLTAPSGGIENLSCFADANGEAKAQRVLKSLVHNSDTVDHICRIRDVSKLSDTDRKALALARALYLRPRVYLLDRPEDGASDALLHALAKRIQTEARLGSIFLIATENRQLLEACDKLMMLQNGRMIELAPSTEINARLSAGWLRFVTERDPDSEEALDSWICSQFRRDGDDANRRKVCLVANEMLAVACQQQIGQVQNTSVNFEFKHQKGQCILQTVEKDAVISSASLEQARRLANETPEGGVLTPLAKIFKHARTVETVEISGRHLLKVEIETYDPRKEQPREYKKNAQRNG
jgi:ABC-type multidrug transport system ATPase subunit